MAYAELRNVKLYYESMGEQGKNPLILIMGLGGNADWWGPGFKRHLSTKRHVIAFDNRGCERTITSDTPFTIEEMADDVADLMTVLDLEQADVFGVSMGGMISQEFSLRHPDKLRKLILGCTTCGGERQVPPTPLAQQLLMSTPDSIEDAKRNHWRLLFPDSFIEKHEPLLEEAYKMLMAHPMARSNFLRQFQAIQQWRGTYDRLPSLSHETLILHGTEDILLPAGNSDILKERIPNSTRTLYEGAGHGFTTQNAAQVIADVTAFLDK